MRAFFSTLIGLAMVTAATPVQAQQRGGTGGSSSGGFSGGTSGGGFSGSSSSGGFSGGTSGGGFSGSSSGGFSGGTSGGGFSGSSSGGFSGGTSGGFSGSSSGGFSGGTGGGFAGGTSGGATGGRAGGTGTTQYGTTSFLGSHYGTPLAMGAVSTGGASRTGTTGNAVTNYQSLSFGQPVYNVQNTATVSRGGTGSMLGGTTAGGLGIGGQGGLGQQQGNAGFRGASSAGIRRAPQYTTEPVFVRSAAPTAVVTQGVLREVLTSSSRLPSAGRIEVTNGDGRVVLRGTVGTDRERRIAEAMIRMTPGVREVKNELVTEKTP